LRITRSVVILILAVTLLSCDVFFISKNGRWNLLDPDNELVDVKDRVIGAVLDGYVEDDDTRYFYDPVLVSNWDPSPPRYAPLIIFDFSKLPTFVEYAELQIYNTSSSATGWIDVYVLGQPWDPDTIVYAPIESGTIVDFAVPFVVLDLPAVGSYFSCDITEMVQYMQDKGSNYGFILAWSSVQVQFDSSEGDHPPRLVVSGKDIPD